MLCGINDYHGIDRTPSVCKVPLRLGGVVPVVLFVAARDVAPGAELTLKYVTRVPARDHSTDRPSNQPINRPGVCSN